MLGRKESDEGFLVGLSVGDLEPIQLCLVSFDLLDYRRVQIGLADVFLILVLKGSDFARPFLNAACVSRKGLLEGGLVFAFKLHLVDIGCSGVLWASSTAATPSSLLRERRGVQKGDD